MSEQATGGTPVLNLSVAVLACLLSLWLLVRGVDDRGRVRCVVWVGNRIPCLRSFARRYKNRYHRKWRREGKKRRRQAKQLQEAPITIGGLRYERPFIITNRSPGGERTRCLHMDRPVTASPIEVVY